jgi:hypothetical protein
MPLEFSGGVRGNFFVSVKYKAALGIPLCYNLSIVLSRKMERYNKKQPLSNLK